MGVVVEERVVGVVEAVGVVEGVGVGIVGRVRFRVSGGVGATK